MTDDKDNSNTPATTNGNSQVTPIKDLVELADRTLDKTFKGITKIAHDYGDNWNDSFGDTLTTTIPSFIWSGRDQFNQRRDAWFGELSDSGVSGVVTSEPEIALDTSKPTNIWAFPVPSTKQYAQCKELEGQSIWTREGVWRCLFPQNNQQLEQELQMQPSEDRKLFADYTSYLDWKTAFRKAMAAQRQRERQELKQQWEKERELYANPKYISQTEAEKSGKRVISSSVSSETISKEDGSLETKKVVQKWYEDGTSSVTETVSTSPDQSSKGWFWK